MHFLEFKSVLGDSYQIFISPCLNYFISLPCFTSISNDIFEDWPLFTTFYYGFLLIKDCFA